MSESSLVRAAAARCLHAVMNGQSLDAALIEYQPKGGQQGLFKALAYQTVRWQPRLSYLVTLLIDKPLRTRDMAVNALLQVGLCDLSIMNTPDHAVVSETVNAVRDLRKPGLASLVNGVLRRYLRDRAKFDARLGDNECAAAAHPRWIVDLLRADWPEQWQDIIDGGNQQAPMWLRVNRARISVAEYLDVLGAAALEAERSDWVDEAVCLVEPRDVEELPGFADGLVSVQDAAAQLAGVLLDPQPGERVLDACAAPGGKTGHLLERVNGDLDLLAIDHDQSRLARVDENLLRLGWQCETRVADAADTSDWWDGRPFQRVLLDTPCSGSGVIRRHPDIKLLRRPDDPGRLSETQQRLLIALWPTLAIGGLLLYCNCSVFRQENQSQISRFLNTHSDAELLPLSDRLKGRSGSVLGPGLQIFPGQGGMDGFYYAALKKHG